jgi:hypothetical protein
MIAIIEVVNPTKIESGCFTRIPKYLNSVGVYLRTVDILFFCHALEVHLMALSAKSIDPESISLRNLTASASDGGFSMNSTSNKPEAKK